jgi:hypothetical protein
MKQEMPLEQRFWLKVVPGDGCWEWHGTINSRGYGFFDVGRQKRQAHRMAYEFAYGPIPPGMCICHRCDNSRCVRPDHLFLGTQADNVEDAVQKGRRKWGHKLTAEQVTEIREAVTSGRASRTDMARKHGVHQGTITKILSRQRWPHL